MPFTVELIPEVKYGTTIPAVVPAPTLQSALDILYIVYT